MNCNIMALTIIISIIILIRGIVGLSTLYFNHKEKMKDKENGK